MLELLEQPGGSAWVTDAINWTGDGLGDSKKIGISPEAIIARADRGLRRQIGQMYGIVGPGLIMAQHVFRGLRRGMLVRGDDEAAAKKLAITWAAKRDATFAGDRFDGRLEYVSAPENCVFAVYVSPNEMGTSNNDAVGVKLDVSRGLPDRGQA